MKKKILFSVLFLSVFAVGAYFIFNQSTVRVHTLSRNLSVSDLSKEADLILIGKLESSSTSSENDPSAGSLVFTDWKVTPIEVWKGTPPKLLIVSFLGGSRFGTTVQTENVQKLKKGQESLLYLTYIPEKNRWVPLSSAQGVYSKVNGKFQDALNKSIDQSVYKSTLKNMGIH